MDRFVFSRHPNRLDYVLACFVYQLEAELKFRRRQVVYEIGNRYAELITQFLMTFIEYLPTYHPDQFVMFHN